MGPHPAVAAVRLAVRQTLAGLAPDAKLIVACSGGADSTALAAATAFVSASRSVAAVSVDHGLQDGSAAQAARTASFAYELGLDPVHVVRVNVGAHGGPEAAARNARYEAIQRVADGAYVLLGHTRDDQAETVLLGLGRGSGPRSIAGMRTVDGKYVRPLLDIDRSTTVAACAALGLTVWHDPHNAQSRFRRVRVRQEVLPLLEDVLDGGVTQALARTATQVRDDLDALDAIAAQVGIEVTTGGELDAEALMKAPTAVRSRVVRRWLLDAGVPAITSVHIGSLLALLADWHGQGGTDLPGGYSVLRRSGRLCLYPHPR